MLSGEKLVWRRAFSRLVYSEGISRKSRCDRPRSSPRTGLVALKVAERPSGGGGMVEEAARAVEGAVSTGRLGPMGGRDSGDGERAR